MADKKEPGGFQPDDEGYYRQGAEPPRRPEAPAVSGPQGRNYIILVFIAGLVIALLFFTLGGEETKKTTAASNSSELPSSSVEPKLPPVTLPSDFTRNQLPPIDNISPPIPPPPPAPPINTGSTGQTTIMDPNTPSVLPADSSEKEKRQKSSIMISSGTKPGATSPTDPYTGANQDDPNLSFAGGFLGQEKVPKTEARKLPNLNRIITQGKMIDAVLETPINTDVPGMIRGVVSRDVFAESGKTVLIPKGSRMIGTYNSFVLRGNKRVNIIWNRVIRPDGIDISIRSPGADQLARAGINGEVDNKYLEIFSSAFLLSAINIGVAYGVEAMSDNKISQTTNSDGSTTKTTTPTGEAALRAVDTFGGVAGNLTQQFFNLRPTITVDQGTRVKVFVNRDLMFPSSLVSQVNFIQ